MFTFLYNSVLVISICLKSPKHKYLNDSSVTMVTGISCFQMGYGSRALELLQQYYEHRIPSLSETDAASLGTAPAVDTEVCGCRHRL